MSRVFVAHYSMLSPLGLGSREVAEALRESRRPAREITNFRTDGLEAARAAEVDDRFLSLIREKDPTWQETIHFDRKLALAAACFWQDEEILRRCFGPIPAFRKGIHFGIGLDTPPVEHVVTSLAKFQPFGQQAYLAALLEKKQGNELFGNILNPLDLPALYLARQLELAAFQRSVMTSCTASTQAISFAADSIRAGRADAVLAGGSDSILNLRSFIAFSKLGINSRAEVAPGLICRPFDTRRCGTLLGEAAGVMVLMSERGLELAGMEPLLELVGWGNSLDGHKITAPDPSGAGIRAALRQAISTGWPVEQLDYINLHGTGTLANDPVELEAVNAVLGPRAAGVRASSTKDRHGHAIAAAGIQEAVLTALCVEHGVIPATLNLENPIPQAPDGIRLVRGKNEEGRIRYAISQNFAFGGVNTVLAFRNLRC